jgi:hypothetical protein
MAALAIANIIQRKVSVRILVYRTRARVMPQAAWWWYYCRSATYVHLSVQDTGVETGKLELELEVPLFIQATTTNMYF